MLNSLYPVSFEMAAISPIHCTVSLTVIIVIVTDILIARLPAESTIAMFLVHFVVAIIAVESIFVTEIRWHFLPFSFAMLHAEIKLTCVTISIAPLVLAIT